MGLQDRDPLSFPEIGWHKMKEKKSTMGKAKIHLRPQRTFTEEFKKARVKEYETGELS